MNRIALLRKAQGLTQKELGAIVDVAQNTICNWENENREPHHEALKKMASIFDCSIDYLLGHTDQRKEPAPEDRGGPVDPLRSTLLHNFDQLNQEGRERLVETSDDMVSSGKYIKSDSVGLGKEA